MAGIAISETLDADEIRAVRALLDRAFGGGFGDDDWGQAVGGHHVVVRRDGALVAHAAVVPRHLHIGQIAHRVGYVEAVATEPAAQGAGHGTVAMRTIENVIRDQYGIGVLSTGEHDFYARLGWRRWQGPTWVRRTSGEVDRTPDDDDGIMVWTAGDSPPIDVGMPITCDERPGDDW